MWRIHSKDFGGLVVTMFIVLWLLRGRLVVERITKPNIHEDTLSHHWKRSKLLILALFYDEQKIHDLDRTRSISRIILRLQPIQNIFYETAL